LLLEALGKNSEAEELKPKRLAVEQKQTSTQLVINFFKLEKLKKQLKYSK
jgi:hypothetical protein